MLKSATRTTDTLGNPSPTSTAQPTQTQAPTTLDEVNFPDSEEEDSDKEPTPEPTVNNQEDPANPPNQPNPADLANPPNQPHQEDLADQPDQTDHENEPVPANHVNVSHLNINIQPGMPIEYKSTDDSWQKATITSRAGRANGVHKNWWNIETQDGTNLSVELSPDTAWNPLASVANHQNDETITETALTTPPQRKRS